MKGTIKMIHSQACGFGEEGEALFGSGIMNHFMMKMSLVLSRSMTLSQGNGDADIQSVLSTG